MIKEDVICIYLAGPINGCTDEEAKDWRQTLKLELDLDPDSTWNTIDPMKRDYRGREEDCHREVVELDKRDDRLL